MTTATEYEARRWEARQLLKNPPDWLCANHRYVDINDPPEPEMLVCSRCGYVRSKTKPIGGAALTNPPHSTARHQ